MVKQKIQDNLSVLENDCVKVLKETEKVLHVNINKKNKDQTLQNYLIASRVTFVIVFFLLLMYLFINVFDFFAEFISSPSILRTGLWNV